MTARTGIVDRARSGDREAFGELYAAYQPQVYAFVHHRTGDRHLAEDLTSETFARALARIDSFAWQGRDIGAWLVTIARNLITDHYKSARAKRETPVGDMRDHDWAAGDPATEVTDRLTRTAQARTVRQAMTGLTGPQQHVLRLRYWDELPFWDIAQLTGRKVTAVKMLKARAVLHLRQHLTDPATADGPTSRRERAA